MAKLSVEVVTAERKVYADEVDMVVAPGSQGVLGILPRHAPLLTTLQPGILRVKKGTEEVVMSVTGGFLQVNANRVLVLADAAEREGEVDATRAEAARARAGALLAEALQRGDVVQVGAARSALSRSLARLQVARRRRRRPAP